MQDNLDEWQKKVLLAKGNILVRSGRQVGKSYIIALKCAKWILTHPNKFVLIISKTEKQAGWIYAKTLGFVQMLSPRSILKGKDRPTKHIFKIKNRTSVNCFAAGETGFGLMGPTVNLFIADEAPYINDLVFRVLNPAMAVAKAEQWLLGTPYLDEGYFYECEMNDSSFTVFKDISSEDCPRKDQPFLDREKKKLTKAEYAQLYLGQYSDQIRRFFTDAIIDRACTGQRRPNILKRAKYYYGCDVARMDRDEFTHEVIDRSDRERLIHVENIVTLNMSIPDSVRRIINLNKQYHFKKEYIDSGGMGITVCDLLREDSENRRKVVEINNASRPYEVDETRTKKILKEDLYQNLKRLMETGKLELLDDENVRESLKSIQVDTDKETGRVSITGRYSHIVEGLIRAAWCVTDRTLDLWCR